MALSDSTNFGNSGYRAMDAENIIGFDVYNKQNKKVGQVIKAGVAGIERSPYLIIKVGSWLANRQVLLSLRGYRVNLKAHRIDIDGWSQEEIDQLPDYPIQAKIEDANTTLETSTTLESSAALESPIAGEIYVSSTNPVKTTSEVPLSAPISHEPEIPLEPSAKILEEEIIPLLAERVIVDRHKRKSGEIVIRKVIETEIIEVVVRREKLIVEQVSPEYKELAVIDLGRTSTEAAPPFQTKDDGF